MERWKDVKETVMQALYGRPEQSGRNCTNILERILTDDTGKEGKRSFKRRFKSLWICRRNFWIVDVDASFGDSDGKLLYLTSSSRKQHDNTYIRQCPLSAPNRLCDWQKTMNDAASADRTSYDAVV
mmetsp:Transcript_17801/g.30079  ORF Transcript_17801/g.30079 Transcript_17801/m.30079 type:complete len:126 (+) Transcript_17801:284-661(+)